MTDDPRDYNATADYFERRAANARNEEVRARLKQVAARYRAMAQEQAEQKSSEAGSPKSRDPSA